MRMKYTAFFSILLATGMCFYSCNKKAGNEKQTKSLSPEKEILIPDTALYGKLGEGTGMSCIEIITNTGDTLTLNKVNEQTGDAGILLGGTEHYGDSLTITTDQNRENIITFVNIKTLTKEWQTNPDSIILKLNPDGTMSFKGKGKQWNHWRMWNTHLILSKQEEATQAGGDTFEIRELNRDSLIIANQHNALKFYKK